jgi:hypothetical protein
MKVPKGHNHYGSLRRPLPCAEIKNFATKLVR